MPSPPPPESPTANILNRSLRPDGRLDVERVGISQSARSDLYHFLFTTSWTRLLGSFALLWLGLNVLFAFGYLAGGNCIEGAEGGSFKDAFFFSVQTLSTIGYGGMTPRTDWAHFLVTAEAFLGLLLTAMTTGMVFSKFSRPTARVVYSDTILVTRFEGRPALVFRVANARDSNLVEASVQLTLTIDEAGDHGGRFRKLYDLDLRRSRSPIFALTWSVVHFLDESSPMFGMGPEDLERGAVTILTNLQGTDEVLVQSVHARHAYSWQDVRWGRRFVDVVGQTPDGRLRLDYTRFHETLPMEG